MGFLSLGGYEIRLDSCFSTCSFIINLGINKNLQDWERFVLNLGSSIDEFSWEKQLIWDGLTYQEQYMFLDFSQIELDQFNNSSKDFSATNWEF